MPVGLEQRARCRRGPPARRPSASGPRPAGSRSSSRSRGRRCRSCSALSWSSTRTLARLILIVRLLFRRIGQRSTIVPQRRRCRGRGTCSGPRAASVTRPAASSTSRCWEMACRDEPRPCFIVSRAQISNSVWPSRSVARRGSRASRAPQARGRRHRCREYRQVITCLSTATVGSAYEPRRVAVGAAAGRRLSRSVAGVAGQPHGDLVPDGRGAVAARGRAGRFGARRAGADGDDGPVRVPGTRRRRAGRHARSALAPDRRAVRRGGVRRAAGRARVRRRPPARAAPRPDLRARVGRGDDGADVPVVGARPGAA